MTEFVVKDGWKLSKHAENIKKAVERNDGYCPCLGNQLVGDDRFCPCKDYRENDICHCNLYLKKKYKTKYKICKMTRQPDLSWVREEYPTEYDTFKQMDEILAQLEKTEEDGLIYHMKQIEVEDED